MIRSMAPGAGVFGIRGKMSRTNPLKLYALFGDYA